MPFLIPLIPTIIGIAVSVGLKLVSTLLMAKAKQPDAGFGDRAVGGTFSSSDPIGYWRVIFGEARVGLQRIYRGSSSNDHWFHEVGVLASHEVAAIGTVFVGDRPVYDTDLDGSGVVTSGYFINDSLRLQKKLGTADQTAFADLVAESANGEWTESHRARGHALLYARFSFAPGTFPGGPPNLSAVVCGCKVYDTRDATTKWTPNAALCIRHFLLLPRNQGGYGATAAEVGNGSDWSAAANICDEIVAVPTTGDAAVMSTISAVDASANTLSIDGTVLKLQRGDRVEVASTGAVPGGLSAATPYYVIPERERTSKSGNSATVYPCMVKLATSLANAYAGTAINITDAGSGSVTVTKTGEPRYTINGWFDTSQSPRKVLAELLTACGGRVPEGGGLYRLMGIAWEAPVLPLDEDDLRGPLKVQTKRSRRDRFNAIKGTYVSPQNDWAPSDYPPITSATYEAQDNDERLFGEYDQPYTSRAGQAQRLAKLELARNRLERTCSYPASPAAYDCRPGQAVAISNDRWEWAEKPFEVVERKTTIGRDADSKPYMKVELALNETSEDIFDWSSTEHQGDAPVVLPTLPDWNNIAAPGTPGVSEYLYEGRDGSDVKTVVRLGWTASPSAMVEGYETEFWPSTGTEDDAVAFATPVNAAVLLADRFDVEPGRYVFRVRGTTALGAKTAWSTTSAIEIFGLTADPVAIANLTGQSLGGQFVLRWTLHADADVRRGGWIEFRHSPSVSGSSEGETTTIGDKVDGRSTSALLPFKDGTYYVRAIDKLGNAGPWASASTIGSTALAWSALGSITEDATFPGAHSGTAVAGATLTLDGATAIDSWGNVDDVVDWDTEGGILTTGTYTFSAGIDLSSVQRTRVRSHVLCSTVNIRDLIDSRLTNIDDWENFDGETAPGASDAWVEVRATNDDPAGTPAWSAWQRLDVAEFNARAFQFRAQLRSYDTAYRPEITQLRCYAEDPSI